MTTTVDTIIEYATTLLKEGKLVAIPTETVYGLGADAKNPKAVEKVYAAKGRPAANPLIIHIPTLDAISEWAVNIPEDAYRLAKAFWPGPLTLILRRHPNVPLTVTGGQETVAIRIPNHPLALALLKRFGSGIAAPSANRYGRISPTTATHVHDELGSEVDFVIDGGPCSLGIESTIVSMLGPVPIILREGSILGSMISAVLGKEVKRSATAGKHANLQDSQHEDETRVPGLSLSHYAPEKPLYLLDKETLFARILELSRKGQRISVISFSKNPHEHDANISQWVEATKDPEKYAHDLYAMLHILDKTHCDCILVEMPPTGEPWHAIQDRLQRAAHRSA